MTHQASYIMRQALNSCRVSMTCDASDLLPLYSTVTLFARLRG